MKRKVKLEIFNSFIVTSLEISLNTKEVGDRILKLLSIGAEVSLSSPCRFGRAERSTTSWAPSTSYSPGSLGTPLPLLLGLLNSPFLVVVLGPFIAVIAGDTILGAAVLHGVNLRGRLLLGVLQEVGDDLGSSFLVNRLSFQWRLLAGSSLKLLIPTLLVTLL